MTEGAGDEDARCLQRHVTVYAATEQPGSMAGKEPTVLDGVTRETATRERDHVAVLAVYVVAAGAGHLRRTEARAALE